MLTGWSDGDARKCAFSGVAREGMVVGLGDSYENYWELGREVIFCMCKNHTG
jgi:hypothetical protein